MEFAKLPQHIAFIMDGNGRWAQSRGLIRLEGHRRGMNTVQRVIEECVRLEIPYLTLWAFSTKNWKRPEEEVNGLFNLMREYFKTKLDELKEKGVRIRFIGNRMVGEEFQAFGLESKLDKDVLELMARVEEETAHNTKITVALAINYSGRDELMRAMGFWAEDVLAGVRKPWELNEEIVSSYLDTAGMPDPDVIIRTGGEQRLSDFLPWQMGDAELVFTSQYWPNFTEKDLHTCLSAFAKRERRFGGVLPVLAAKGDDEAVDAQ